MYDSKVKVDFLLCLKDFLIFFCAKNFLFGFYNFPEKKFVDLTLFKYFSYKHHQLLQHHQHHQHLQHPQHQQEKHRLTSSHLFQTMAVSD